MHSIYLHTGRVLIIDQGDYGDATNQKAEVVTVDPMALPSQPDIQFVDDQDFGGHWLFCSGNVHLPDGRIFFSGGGGSCALPMRNTTVFAPLASGGGTLAAGPIEHWDGVDTYRWYPTCTLLGTGDVLITDGCQLGTPDIPAVLEMPSPTISTWTWEPLSAAQYNTTAPNNFELEVYPFMFLLPDGRVFMAGTDGFHNYQNPLPR